MKHFKCIIPLLLVFLVLCTYGIWHFTAEQRELARGRELLKIAPENETGAWADWFVHLSNADQAAYMAGIEEKVTPPEPTQG